MNFECRENKDGSFELYNTDIGDIYFSNIGAYNESMQKFVLPANVDLKNIKKLRILDACYGMGYNSKSFVNYVLKINSEIEIEIDAVDIDKKIYAFSLLLMDENISDFVHIDFGKNLLNQINLDKILENFSGENWIKRFYDKFLAKNAPYFLKNDLYLHKKDEINKFLHNIYYQNQEFYIKNLKIYFFEEELSGFLTKNTQIYDLIFHDAFSILKQPELWSKEIMQRYYDLLDDGGKFLTYSNSRVLRRTLAECGFEVIINTIGDRKQNGTIGIK